MPIRNCMGLNVLLILHHFGFVFCDWSLLSWQGSICSSWATSGSTIASSAPPGTNSVGANWIFYRFHFGRQKSQHFDQNAKIINSKLMNDWLSNLSVSLIYSFIVSVINYVYFVEKQRFAQVPRPKLQSSTLGSALVNHGPGRKIRRTSRHTTTWEFSKSTTWKATTKSKTLWTSFLSCWRKKKRRRRNKRLTSRSTGTIFNVIYLITIHGYSINKW